MVKPLWAWALSTTTRGMQAIVILPKPVVVNGFTELKQRPPPFSINVPSTFSGDGRLLAGVNGSSTKLTVADLIGGEQFDLLLGMSASDLTLSPSGALLGVGDWNGQVQIWDLRRRRLLQQFRQEPGRVSMAFTPDDRRLVTTHKGGLLRIRNVGPARRNAGVGHKGPVRRVAFSHDGTQLVSAGADGRIISWDLASGRPLWLQQTGGGDTFSMAFSPDGHFLATAGRDGMVRFWDRRNNRQVRRFRGHPRPIWDMSYSPDGKILATADQVSTRLWDSRSGKLLVTHKLSGSGFSWQPLGYNPGALAFFPDGKMLARAKQLEVLLLAVPSGKVLANVICGMGAQVAFGPRGTMVVADIQGVTRLYTAPGGKYLGRLTVSDKAGRLQVMAGTRGLSAVRPHFHPAGKQIVMVTPRARAGWVMVQLVAKMNRVQARLYHRSAVLTAAFQPGGKYLATGTRDGAVHLWDLQRRRPVWHEPLPAAEVRKHSGKPQPPWQRALSETRLASMVRGKSACLVTFDGRLELWDTTMSRRLLQAQLKSEAAQVLALRRGCVVRSMHRAVTLHRPGIPPMILAAHGKCGGKSSPPCVSAMARYGDRFLLARGAALEELDSDGVIKRRVTIPAGAQAVGRFGAHLVISPGRGKVLRLPATGGKKAEPLEDVPPSAVEAMTAGPTGTTTVAIGFTTGDVGLWDLSSGDLLVRVKLRGPATSLTLRGSILHAASALGDRRTLDLSALTADYCDFIRRVRQEVPVAFEDPRFVPAPPPAGHRCKEPR